jgi:NADH-quinone oxidoreductase subunit C
LSSTEAGSPEDGAEEPTAVDEPDAADVAPAEEAADVEAEEAPVEEAPAEEAADVEAAPAAEEAPAEEAPAEEAPAEEAPAEEVGDPRRQALVDQLRAELADDLLDVALDPGRDVCVRVATGAWRRAGQAARDRLGLHYFCFLSVIDWLPSPFGRGMDAEVDRALAGNGARDPEPVVHGLTGGETRFQVFARLYSVTDHIGLTLKADVPDDTTSVESWATVYAGANWHEREAWEMYGIGFDGHPNLRKLYLPGAFEGHPQRKDFPLLSRVVKPWPGIVDVEGMPGVADDEGGE